MHTGGDRGILSRPMQVIVPALGMESTTFQMQQAGWEFSAEQDVYRMEMNLLARHQAAKLYFLARQSFEYYEAWTNPKYQQEQVLIFHGVSNCNYRPAIVPADMFANYTAVDMTPRLVERTTMNIEDLKVFASAHLAVTNEIIVEEKDVPTLLAEILSKQEAGRQEYHRQKLRESREGLAGAGPEYKFHAQILSIA